MANLPSPSSREVFRLMAVLCHLTHSTEDQLPITDRLARHTCMELDTTDTASQVPTEDPHNVVALSTTCLQPPTEDIRTKNKRRPPRKPGEPNSTWFYSSKDNAVRSKSHAWPQKRLSKSGTSSTATKTVGSPPTLSRDFCRTTHNSTFLTPTPTTSTKLSDPEKSSQESQMRNSSKHSAVSSQALKEKNRMVQTNSKRENRKIIMKTTSSRTANNNQTQRLLQNRAE